MNTKGNKKRKNNNNTRSSRGNYNSKYKSKKVNTKLKKKKTVRKVRYGRIFLCIILPICIFMLLITFVEFPIKNIFISGNNILSDQEIIELADISDYPSIFKYSSNDIKKKLKSNKYIDNVKVYKKNLKELHIEIEENKPVLYYLYNKKTTFSNMKSYKGIYSTLTLLNYTPTNCYDLLVKGLISIDSNILVRISEIQYVPNEVDDERFLLTMNDGNYVYITLSKIDLLDSYIEIIKSFDGKKGVLYLDSGEYFEIK